jgi:hypothetical protein
MRSFSTIFVLGLLVIGCGRPTSPSQTSDSFGQVRYPSVPDKEHTPGKLCEEENSTALRYPEKILYCKRDVQTETKDAIIAEYDEEMGYSIGDMQRSQFKIDHFIPLCAGGSNSVKNLWPQHQSVYKITDPIEPRVCQLMGLGGITQNEVVAMVNFAKFNHSEVEGIVDELNQRIEAAKASQ